MSIVYKPYVKNNFRATSAPSATDDSSKGFKIGSVWIDTNADKSYICVDDALGAAIWVEQSNSASSRVAGLDKQLQFNDSGNFGGANIYYDKANGYLGIATSVPHSQLHIKGDIILDGSVNSIGVGDAQTLTVGSWDTTWLTFTKRAQFGSKDFEVFGGVIVANNKSLAWRDNTNTVRNIMQYDLNNDLIISQPIAHNMHIKTNNATRLFIASTGNVGIGTSTPKHTFEVKGIASFMEPVKDNAASASVSITDSNGNYTNTGATTAITLTLPVPTVGAKFRFIVTTAQTLTVQADATSTIRVGNAVSVLGGTIASASVGDVVELLAVSATEWVAVNIIGNWSLT